MFVLVQYARFNNTVKMSVGRMCSNVCSECAVCVHLITSCTTWGFIPACLIHISGNMWHLGMHRCVSQRCTPSCSKTKKFNKGLRMSQCAQGKHRFRQRIYLLFILSCFFYFPSSIGKWYEGLCTSYQAYLYVQILIQKDVLQLEVSMHNAALQREQRHMSLPSNILPLHASTPLQGLKFTI